MNLLIVCQYFPREFLSFIVKEDQRFIWKIINLYNNHEIEKKFLNYYILGDKNYMEEFLIEYDRKIIQLNSSDNLSDLYEIFINIGDLIHEAQYYDLMVENISDEECAIAS